MTLYVVMGKTLGFWEGKGGVRRSLAHRSGQEAISLGVHIIPLSVSFHPHEAATIASASEDCLGDSGTVHDYGK